MSSCPSQTFFLTRYLCLRVPRKRSFLQGTCVFVSLANVLSYKVLVSSCPSQTFFLTRYLCLRVPRKRSFLQGTCVFVSLANVLSYKVLVSSCPSQTFFLTRYLCLRVPRKRSFLQGTCVFVSLANVLSYKVLVSSCPSQTFFLTRYLCLRVPRKRSFLQGTCFFVSLEKPCVPLQNLVSLVCKTLRHLQNLVFLAKSGVPLQNLVSLVCKTLCSLFAKLCVPCLQNFVSLANIRFLHLLFLFDILLSHSLLYFFFFFSSSLSFPASVLSFLASFLLLGLQGEKDQLQVPALTLPIASPTLELCSSTAIIPAFRSALKGWPFPA